MNDMIACCGLDCAACDAYIATVNDDQVLREKTASLWSALNQAPITASDINCRGCRADGVKTVFCSDLCPIRKCAREKGHPTCGGCDAVDDCPTVGAIFASTPAARENLGK